MIWDNLVSCLTCHLTVPGREGGIGQGCTGNSSSEKTRFRLRLEGIVRGTEGINCIKTGAKVRDIKGGNKGQAGPGQDCREGTS